MFEPAKRVIPDHIVDKTREKQLEKPPEGPLERVLPPWEIKGDVNR
jgi:hypothetical protein